MNVRMLAIIAAAPLLSPQGLAAQDADAVRQAVIDHYAAINAGDLEAVIEQHTERFTGFLSDGGVMHDYASRAEQRRAWIEEVEGEFEMDWRVRDLVVHTFGEWALATFYLDGWVKRPDGSREEGPWRVSEVWVKQGGEWKELHHHHSRLRIQQ